MKQHSKQSKRRFHWAAFFRDVGLFYGFFLIAVFVYAQIAEEKTLWNMPAAALLLIYNSWNVVVSNE